MINVFHDLQILLLNVFFIFTFFFVYLKFIEKKIHQLTNKLLIFLTSGSSIVLCMTFSIQIGPGQLIDMRYVPFIVGAFYGGRRVALLLFLILITYRFGLGGSGFYINLAGSILLLISLWFMIPFFEKTVNLAKRLRYVMEVAFLSALYTGAALSLFYSEIMSIKNLMSFITFIYIQVIGIILFVKFIERARNDMALATEIRKLEKLKSVSEVAASISHEVRNPLTVTRGFIQLLSDDNLTNEQKNFYISTSLEELDRAASIITDYLTFATPSLENVEMLELNKELDHIIKTVTPLALMNAVGIEIQKTEAIYIAGEREKLHQCLINLIKNSIEAMPGGGKLMITLQVLNDKVVITVADTGAGMTDEQIERLGTPYFSTKVNGTGLGTMVIFSIVKAMMGEIKVDSEIGKGTCFTILFPTVAPFHSSTEKTVD
ncbi:ATP-binding protein [Domibacillus sp. A3M-37]|uniref:ATP-binding protein n=1 Tax=Domibacillus TaxID=1433999 RepID=UPI000617F8CB|nr:MULTISPECIES: ATP-binding protein [Domibacillus]MCP3764193.1 ATP-binding protein [Domibacillus sp. A3M-37]